MFSNSAISFQPQGLSTYAEIYPFAVLPDCFTFRHTERLVMGIGEKRVAHRQAPCVEKASCPARLSLLGPLRLSDANGHDRTPSSLQQQAILVILALSPDGKVSRARLQDLLWGEKSPQRAAQSLRTALHGLRRSLANAATGPGDPGNFTV